MNMVKRTHRRANVMGLINATKGKVKQHHLFMSEVKKKKKKQATSDCSASNPWLLWKVVCSVREWSPGQLLGRVSLIRSGRLRLEQSDWACQLWRGGRGRNIWRWRTCRSCWTRARCTSMKLTKSGPKSTSETREYAPSLTFALPRCRTCVSAAGPWRTTRPPWRNWE